MAVRLSTKAIKNISLQRNCEVLPSRFVFTAQLLTTCRLTNSSSTSLTSSNSSSRHNPTVYLGDAVFRCYRCYHSGSPANHTSILSRVELAANSFRSFGCIGLPMLSLFLYHCDNGILGNRTHIRLLRSLLRPWPSRHQCDALVRETG